MQRRDVQESAARATQAPVSNLMDTISRSSKSVPLAPSKKSIATPRGSILSEIAKAERKEQGFPSLRRFVRPVLASLLIVIILVGLIMGGIYVTRLVSQIVEPGTLPPKTYTLSKSVIPEAGGDIRITSPSSSSEAFEPGTQVTLMAVPNSSYTFDYWEDFSNSSETMTVTMDSDKSVAAHFKLKDTTPPEISSIEVSNITELCATVTWKTDDLTTGQVEYGKTDVYNLTTPPDEKLTTNQRIRLTGLEANTIYHFRIISQNASRLQAVSMDRTFKTVSPQPAKVGNRAPDFALPQLEDNSTIVLSDFVGKKVLLNLWATDCPGCVLELPYIQEIYVKHADLAVLTVCLDKNVDSIAKFAEEHPELTFPILVNQPSITKGGYNIRVIPTTFFIGSDGIIKEIKSGSFQNSEQIGEKLGSID
jgi:peroxiredoxin